MKQECDLVQVISCDESVAWMRDVFLELLQSQLQWETDIETALEQCQVNVKLSDECECVKELLVYIIF